MLEKELLDAMVCTKCKGALDYQEASIGSGEQEKLQCKDCGLIFFIVNGIPDMLIDNKN